MLKSVNQDGIGSTFSIKHHALGSVWAYGYAPDGSIFYRIKLLGYAVAQPKLLTVETQGLRLYYVVYCTPQGSCSVPFLTAKYQGIG